MAKTKETEARTPQTTQSAGEHLQGSHQGTSQGHELQTQGQNQQHGELQGRRQSGLSRHARDPFTMIQQLSAEMDELFDAVFYGRPMARARRQPLTQSLWAPEVEVSEEGNRMRVCVDLPGVPKDAVKVDVRDGMLTIEGERREERTEGGEQQGFRRSERRCGSFYRSIPLREGAQAENAEARMKEGVLEITLPIAAKQSRRLEIQG